ncbi:MAG TPA: GTPase ObgE [Myxococcota bacterium]
MSQFIDEVVLHAKAGDGGNGIVAWRREAHVPLGGPAGGDGGDGGDVVLVADEGVHSLLDFAYNPHLHAKNGQPGRGKKQSGEGGAFAVAKVPIGTQVFDVDSGQLLADLTEHAQRAVICKGGSGGWGNQHFATASRQAPEFSKPGLAGDEKRIRLSLKLMADVGLLGFPNAGKSTFLSRVSAARPKIASYPFTTLVPQLGVVRTDDSTIVVADIPGLIEGAAQGAGLGVQFLKHLERVRVLLHLIEVPLELADGDSTYADDDKTRGPLDLVKRYQALRAELAEYSADLAEVPEVVAINKSDLVPNTLAHPQVKKLLRHLERSSIRMVIMSTATGDGVMSTIRALETEVKRARGPVKKLAFNPFARIAHVGAGRNA